MSSTSRFQVPTLRERGQLAQAMNAVQQFKPEAGEHSGRMSCPKCGSGLRFVILSSGLSRGNCVVAGCIRWCQ